MNRKTIEYGSENTVKSEIEKVILQINHFPTVTELIVSNSGLLRAITKYGGINKFRKLMEYEYLINPKGFWNETTIVIELKKIIEQTGVFPSYGMLRKNRTGLSTAISINGGIVKYRELLGYKPLKKEKGYWSEENILLSLETLCNKLGRFPSYNEIELEYKGGILVNIEKKGGINKYRTFMGYDCLIKPKGYWDDNRIVEELKFIIKNNSDCFPTRTYFVLNNRQDLLGAIFGRGGTNKFRELMGFEPIHKPNGYWTETTIIAMLRDIVEYKHYFPTQKELFDINSQLVSAIGVHGGINKFRSLLGHNYLSSPTGYWTKEKIIDELKIIINILGRFPTENETQSTNMKLASTILKTGGFVKYRKLCGFDASIFEEYKSNLSSYICKRGKRTEILVYNILERYCIKKTIALPKKNVKLCKGNIIEFVCENNKIVGIDVTNSKINKNSVSNKWTKKDYYKHLDELWVVVVSDSFKEEDYIIWNKNSPDNVYVMSIEEFCMELQYDLDEHTKNKIDKYKSCTFHTRNNFKEQSLNTSKIV